ncbi:MAG TPA: DCC1-like thiol-disulfide oxidoreductase family protein [Gemmatimonadaceae bacterium]|nr:DCC1-like thiol-disulfide oxidoreductase family protein [Gemmatimonadaceae bacterium]
MVSDAAPFETPGADDAPAVASPVLFFDGECGFCDRAIRFAMERDSHRRLHVATLAGVTASRELAPFADQLRDVDSTVLYLPPTADAGASVQLHSDAALSVLRMLGGVWSLFGALGLLVPRWIRDAAYKAFARRRFALFGRVDACQLWPADWRARVLP